MNGGAVLGRLGTVVHAVIADHAGDPQPIVLEYGRTAPALGLAMLGYVAPCRNSLFVAEE